MSNEEKSIPLDDLDISDLGLHDSMIQNGLFLGHLRTPEVESVVQQSGLLEELKGRGYKEFTLSVEVESLQDNRIHICIPGGEDLFFLRLHLGSFPLVGPNPARLISIDWFQTQNPRMAHKRLFPGQKYPGLGFGILAAFRSLLALLADRTHAAGIITVPEYFHDAVLFNRYMKCRFLNPEKAADFENLRILGNVRAVSAAIQAGKLQRKNGEVYAWRHGEMVHFRPDYLNAMVFDDSYNRLLRQHLDPKKYVLVNGNDVASDQTSGEDT
ncbi:MAG: hypothetical protein KDK23_11690 [Leptospiraceae bacterium]|nr:hypothetical protein [Leptospiraceae bacterium]